MIGKINVIRSIVGKMLLQSAFHAMLQIPPIRLLDLPKVVEVLIFT